MATRNMEQYAKAYLSSDFEDTMVQFRRRLVMEQIQKYPHKTILEIGCGMEPMFLHLEDDSEWFIVEPAELFCQHAAACVRPNHRVRIIHGMMEEAVNELRGISFDFVICSSLLHELAEPEAMLRAIYAISKENTVIHLNVPNALSLHRLLAKEMGLIQSVYQLSPLQKKLQQHCTFDMKRLKQLVDNEGFTVLNQGSYFLKPFTHTQLQKGMEVGIFNHSILDGMYHMSRHFPDNGAEIYCNIRKRTK